MVTSPVPLAWTGGAALWDFVSFCLRHGVTSLPLLPGQSWADAIPSFPRLPWPASPELCHRPFHLLLPLHRGHACSHGVLGHTHMLVEAQPARDVA